MAIWKHMKDGRVTVTRCVILDARNPVTYRVDSMGDSEMELTFVSADYIEPGTSLRVTISKQVTRSGVA